jgi:histidinol-phosphatase (PHP family)
MLHERGVPVTLGSDAHAPERVGRDFPRALRELYGAGYRTLTVFDGRERRQEVFDV